MDGKMVRKTWKKIWHKNIINTNTIKMETEKQTFKIELKLEELKTKVEAHLEKEIARYIEQNEVNAFLGENIKSIFRTSWDDKRGSKLRQIIDETIERHIERCLYKILEKSDIQKSIEDAVEGNIRDSEFINSLAKAKTMEILTKERQY